MHERALRRKIVIRRSRVPLRRIWRASTNDPSNANTNATNAQTCTAPHRSTKRRAGGMRPRAHAESKPMRRMRRLLWLLWRLLLLRRLRLRLLRLRLLLLLCLRLLPWRSAVDPTRRAESTPSGRWPYANANANARIAASKSTI